MSPICRCGQAEQAVWSGCEGQCGRQRAVRRVVAARHHGQAVAATHMQPGVHSISARMRLARCACQFRNAQPGWRKHAVWHRSAGQ